MRFSFLLQWKYLLVVLLVVLQLSFFKGLGWPWFNLNLLVGISVFLILYGGLEKNLAPIIVGALIVDLFNSYVFGLAAVSILIISYSINFIYLRLFTNRSFFSLLILGAIGVLEYVSLITFFNYFFYWLNILVPGFGENMSHLLLRQTYWYNLLWQIILMMPALTIFYLFGILFKRSQEIEL